MHFIHLNSQQMRGMADGPPAAAYLLTHQIIILPFKLSCFISTRVLVKNKMCTLKVIKVFHFGKQYNLTVMVSVIIYSLYITEL